MFWWLKRLYAKKCRPPAAIHTTKHSIIFHIIPRWNKITLKKYIETKLRQKKSSGDFNFWYIKNIWRSFWYIKIYIKTTIIFGFSEAYQNKYVEVAYKFSIQIVSKKYIETTSIFCSSKLCRKNYIEMRKIFRPLNSSRSKHVEMTSIFDPSKLGQRNVKRNGTCTVNLMETQEKLR